MVEIHTRYAIAHPGGDVVATEQLRLSFDARQKSRLRVRLVSGEEVALSLPRGEVLRGGDLLLASDGRVVEVVARPEKLLHVECGSPEALARAAYHLGNRHVAVQVGDGFLRLAADHVLEEMLRQLGARTTTIEAPFEPEAGAYGGHAHGSGSHTHGDPGHGGRIHEYSDQGSLGPDTHHHHHSK